MNAVESHENSIISETATQEPQRHFDKLTPHCNVPDCGMERSRIIEALAERQQTRSIRAELTCNILLKLIHALAGFQIPKGGADVFWLIRLHWPDGANLFEPSIHILQLWTSTSARNGLW